jgi:SAM-dependent methyltransferase
MFSSVLNRLANRHGSDKGSTVADRHRYAQLYDVLFHNEREGTRKVLELGLARGGPEAPIGGAVERHCGSPSVAMWIEYFPNAAIYGFDISDFAHLEEQFGRFCFLRGDCGSAADLSRLAAMVGDDVDIIIDDASHASFHQQMALRELFGCLRSGGLYVIEDLHWQPPHIESRLPPAHKTIEWLAAFREGTGLLSSVWTGDAIQALFKSVASAVVLTDLQVPGSRYRNSLALLRKA